MSNDGQGPWEGEGPDIDSAIKNAWDNAKNSPSPPGPNRKRYKLKFFIDASNPIHTYIVIIGGP
jgi:hypothetical protein